MDFDGNEYQARFDALTADGQDVHGEATFVRALNPATVLDAGCGTGRVAIELARHDIAVVGVDVDASMIDTACRLAPELEWEQRDLISLDLGRTFDVVVMAGNVPLFAEPRTQSALVAACARHLMPEGLLVAGFQLDRDYDLTDYDAAGARVGLQLVDRFATWDREPFEVADGNYAVSVHRRGTS